MFPNLGSCWGSFGTQSVSVGLLGFRGAGVGLGDKLAVCGDCRGRLCTMNLFDSDSLCRIVVGDGFISWFSHEPRGVAACFAAIGDSLSVFGHFQGVDG